MHFDPAWLQHKHSHSQGSQVWREGLGPLQHCGSGMVQSSGACRVSMHCIVIVLVRRHAGRCRAVCHLACLHSQCKHSAQNHTS